MPRRKSRHAGQLLQKLGRRFRKHLVFLPNNVGSGIDRGIQWAKAQGAAGCVDQFVEADCIAKPLVHH